MAARNTTQAEHIHEPDDDAVVRRLAELDVPIDILGKAVRIGYSKGDFVTVGHPNNYQGMVVWGELTGALRTGLKAKKKWVINNDDNIPRIVSPDGATTIIAVRGNSRTGRRSKHEQLSTLRPRGSAGVRIIRVNTQIELELSDHPESESSDDLAAGLGGTWFLLYNRVNDIVRSELSWARNVDVSGRLLKWKERLILPDVDLSLPPNGDRRDDDGPDDVDVPVKLRA